MVDFGLLGVVGLVAGADGVAGADVTASIVIVKVTRVWPAPAEPGFAQIPSKPIGSGSSPTG